MKAAFVKEGGGVELREIERPKLLDGSVIVEMKASGVCGTDLEKLGGRNITSSILGHEVSGVITESSVSSISSGTKVVPHHHVACGNCELCKVGAGTMCEGFRNSNFVPGGFADEFLVPSYNVERGGVHTFSNNISFEEASFAEPLACCLRGLNRVLEVSHTQPRRELRDVLIVGAGPIGLLHMELIKLRFPDSRIVAVDIIRSRLEFAERLESARVIDSSEDENGSFSLRAKGFLPSGRDGFDLVIVATGSPSVFSEALKCVRKSGTLLLFGAPHRGATHNLDLTRLFLDSLTLTSSYSATDEDLQAALDILEERKINVNKFITSRFPLAKVEDAMSSARENNEVKVLVTN